MFLTFAKVFATSARCGRFAAIRAAGRLLIALALMAISLQPPALMAQNQNLRPSEQSQEKWEPVFRQTLRQNEKPTAHHAFRPIDASHHHSSAARDHHAAAESPQPTTEGHPHAAGCLSICCLAALPDASAPAIVHPVERATHSPRAAPRLVGRAPSLDPPPPKRA